MQKVSSILGSVLLGQSEGFGSRWLDYPIGGNELWRYWLFLLVLLVSVVISRVVRYLVLRAGQRIQSHGKRVALGVLLVCLGGPLSLGVMALGVYLGQWCFRFGANGFSEHVAGVWGEVCKSLVVLGVAYFLYRLVDLVDYYVRRWTSRTETALDDMLVPIVRKSLRLFIIVVCGLFIADNLLKLDIGPLLATAGVGGLALALAAKDTLANLFGSVTIFADRPFQVGEGVRIGKFEGAIEEVGLRSTRIRTGDGHLVTIPNSLIVNEMIENVARRPSIKRVVNLGICCESGAEKVERAISVLKEILAGVPEIQQEASQKPRVYFTEFSESSLNLQVIYWVRPVNDWLYKEVNERVNLAVMKRFAAEGIAMAYPTRTVYLKQEA